MIKESHNLIGRETTSHTQPKVADSDAKKPKGSIDFF